MPADKALATTKDPVSITKQPLLPTKRRRKASFMYFDLRSEQEKYLLSQPETGMGYQIIEATQPGMYIRERFLVLNAGIAIKMDSDQAREVKAVLKEGFSAARLKAGYFGFNIVSVFNERQFRNIVSETKSSGGAIDSPKENADGKEIFVRLSAFEDDKRIDKVNKCLRSGTFTTTEKDYLACKAKGDDPVERYALPNNDEIKWAFYIQPLTKDRLQRGIVQPANGKRGGGEEAYFEDGTSNGTFFKQTAY